jgi:hypothetical protein
VRDPIVYTEETRVGRWQELARCVRQAVRWLAIGLAAGLLVVLAPRPAAQAQIGGGAGGNRVTYPAGWNIVGGPSGTVFPVALYRWDARAGQYVTLAAGTPAAAGQGYWAYFASPTAVQLAASAPQDLPPTPGGTYAMIANPYSAACARLNIGPTAPTFTPDPNVLAVYTYDPAQGSYDDGTGALLEPGQGAWVLLQATAVPPLVQWSAPLPGGPCTAVP